MLNYSSFNFALPDNSINSLISDYLLIDLFFNYNFIFSSYNFMLSLSVRNIRNEQYQIILNYPMPGRSIRAGIGLEI